jgi:branched-chain amino acid transport system permease protein
MIPVNLISELLIVGLMLGLTYALMSIGVTLIYGIMKMANFAHGEFYMLGGYTVFYVYILLNLPTLLAIPFAILTGMILGYCVARFLLSGIHEKNPEYGGEYAMLTTFALAIFLQNFAKIFFGASIVSVPPLITGIIKTDIFVLSLDRILSLFVSAISLFGLYYFIKKTKSGRAWRAAAQNKPGALVTGVEVSKISNMSYAIGGGLAAMAGGLLTPIYSVYPNAGFWPLIISFVAMTLGGLGSIVGAFIASIIIGLTHTFVAAFVGTSYADIAMYIVLITVLFIKPTGLMGRED